MKSALITGITGQDGSYLAEFLIGKGYVVHGIIRRSSSFNTSRIRHIYQDPHEDRPRLVLHYGDSLDSESLMRVLHKIQPDEVYNLAAQSHVRVSFDMPRTLPMWSIWGLSNFLRRFAPLTGLCGFIRLRRLKCLAAWVKRLWMKILH